MKKSGAIALRHPRYLEQPLGGSEKVYRAHTREQAVYLHEQGGLPKESLSAWRKFPILENRRFGAFDSQPDTGSNVLDQ